MAEAKRKRIDWTYWVAIAFTLLILYALSPPLMVTMLSGSGLNARSLDKAIETIYLPLILLVERSDMVKNFYNNYFEMLGM